VFGRFALPAGELFEGGIADLSRCFMVDVRDVDAGDRVASLGEDLVEGLEIAWNAASVRRGPLVARRNALKLAELLAGEGNLTTQKEMDASLVAEALGVAWRVEGRDLQRAAEAADRGELTDSVLEDLISDLLMMGELAQRAAERLSDYRQPVEEASGSAPVSEDPE